jgi:hypothetical protein
MKEILKETGYQGEDKAVDENSVGRVRGRATRGRWKERKTNLLNICCQSTGKTCQSTK